MKRYLCLFLLACTGNGAGKRVLACELLDNGQLEKQPITQAAVAADGSYEINLARSFSSRTILQLSESSTCLPIGSDGTLSAPAVSKAVQINVASELVSRRLLDHTGAFDMFSNAELEAVLAFTADASFKDATVADLEARVGNTVADALAGFRAAEVTVEDGAYNAIALIAGGGENSRFEVMSGEASIESAKITFSGTLRSRQLVEECAAETCGRSVGSARLAGTFASQGTFAAFAGGQAFITLPDGVTRGAVSRNGKRLVVPLALENGADAVVVMVPQGASVVPGGNWAYRRWRTDLAITSGLLWEPIRFTTGSGKLSWSNAGMSLTGQDAYGSQYQQCSVDAIGTCSVLERLPSTSTENTAFGATPKVSEKGAITIGTLDGILPGVIEGPMLVAPTSNEIDTLFSVRGGTPAPVGDATFNIVMFGGALEAGGEAMEVRSGVLRFTSDGSATFDGHMQRSLRVSTCGACTPSFAPTLQGYSHVLRYTQAADGAMTLTGDDFALSAHLSDDGETLILSRTESGNPTVAHAVGLGFLRNP